MHINNKDDDDEKNKNKNDDDSNNILSSVITNLVTLGYGMGVELPVG
jgi:hypothetical protein